MLATSSPSGESAPLSPQDDTAGAGMVGPSEPSQCAIASANVVYAPLGVGLLFVSHKTPAGVGGEFGTCTDCELLVGGSQTVTDRDPVSAFTT